MKTAKNDALLRRGPFPLCGFLKQFWRRLHEKPLEYRGEVYYRIRKWGRTYYRYRGETYPGYLNKGNAASFIRDKAKKWCAGRGIDVGAGRWPFPGAIPVRDEERRNAYSLDDLADGSLDYVFSSHCLEHLERWQEAVALWIRKLKPGGILFLYLPHESMRLWNPGAPWVRDTHKWIPTCTAVNGFLTESGMELLDHNPGRDDYWSFHIIARKIGTATVFRGR